MVSFIRKLPFTDHDDDDFPFTKLRKRRKGPKRQKRPDNTFGDESQGQRKFKFLSGNECENLGFWRSLPVEHGRAIPACGPLSVEFITEHLSTNQDNVSFGQRSYSPFDSPPRTRRQVHTGGLTNQDQVSSMLDESGLNPTTVGNEEIKNQWRRNFTSQALSTLRDNRCIMFSVEHPHLAGHWLVMLKDFDDTSTNNEYACVYDSYTGNVWKLPWSLLNTWFNRYEANEKYVPESVVIVQ